jgi:hypothetical protein
MVGVWITRGVPILAASSTASRVGLESFRPAHPTYYSHNTSSQTMTVPDTLSDLARYHTGS